MQKVARKQGFDVPPLPQNWKVLVGMGGLVAETVLSGETDDAGVLADILFSRIWNGEASASDLALMNISDIDNFALSYDSVDECMRLLRDGWSVVQQEAECLMPPVCRMRVSNQQCAALCRNNLRMSTLRHFRVDRSGAVQTIGNAAADTARSTSRG